MLLEQLIPLSPQSILVTRRAGAQGNSNHPRSQSLAGCLVGYFEPYAPLEDSLLEESLAEATGTVGPI